MAEKKRGRPPIEIDQKQFENICGLQCTLEEIAGWFGCSADTIERWCERTYGAIFADVYRNKSAGGKISLRRAQFRLAEKNAAVSVWLGKQYLGQREPEPVKPAADLSLFTAALSGAPKIGGEDE